MAYAMITGGSTGLGFSLAKGFGKRGMTPILIGRHEKTLAEAQEKLKALHIDADFEVCDVSQSKSVEKMMHHLFSVHKDIAMVINNAGVGIFGSLEQMSIADIHTMIQVNLMGTIAIAKYALPHLKKANKSYLINVVSTAGLRGKSQEAGYCASKFGVRGFTEALKVEYQDNDNLSIIGAYMGGMNTPFWDESDYVKDPSGLASPDEIAEVILDQYRKGEDVVIDKN